MGALGIDAAVAGSSADGEGHYTGTVSRDWQIWGPNGGYLAALVLRAAGAHCQRRRPATISVQFLRTGRFEAIELSTRTLRATRRAECVHVTAVQAGEVTLTAQVWGVDENEGLEHHHAPMWMAGAPEDVPTITERLEAAGRGDEAPNFPFWLNFEARPLDWVEDWESREPTEPVAGGWYRYAHEAPSSDPWVDAGRTVILADTFTWPAAMRAHRDSRGMIAPSLDLTVSLHHDVSNSEWLLVRGAAPVAHGGTIGCTSQVWAADGRLAAIGTGTCLFVPAR